jgi:hypothetical protein
MSNRHIRAGRRLLFAFAGVGVVVLIISAQAAPIATPTPSVDLKCLAEPQVVSPTETDPLPELLGAARDAYGEVTDYTCTFVKQERVRGRLLDPQTIAMSVRARPFSVHLKFLGPESVAGQEACYAEGRHEGRMRVKPAGWKSALGFVTLDLDDPRAMNQNRHTLAEAGIGSLIDKIARNYGAAVEAGQRPALELTDCCLGPNLCTRVEILPTTESDSDQTSVVYFDQRTNLPVRFEAYDASGDLLEEYTYLDLSLNPGVSDCTFHR